MHQAHTSAVKRCGVISLAICLFFAAMPAARGVVFQEGEGVIINNPNGPKFPLLENAASAQSVIGMYNNGVVGYVKAVQNGMVQVRIGGSWNKDDGMTGYVPEGYLRYGDAGIPVEASLPVAEIIPSDGSDAVRLRSEPGMLSSVAGMFPAGVQVEVLGEMPDCFHVQFGEAVGFLPKGALRWIDKQAMFGYSVSRDGFAILEVPEDIRDQQWEVPLYAYPDGEHVTDNSLYDGQTISLLNDLGDWAQVRSGYGGVGFVRTEYLTVYPLADMKVATKQVFSAGSYTVGAEIPPGLYTLDIPAGGRGGIEAMGQGNGAYHNYYADDSATFAMYLTEPMTVAIEGQAVLSPMDTERLIAEDIGWHYSGSGRFFCGVQLRSHWVFMYEVTLQPGESVGYIARTNLSTETGGAGRSERFYLTPGQTEYISMTQGEFIEFRNCVIVGRRGNG